MTTPPNSRRRRLLGSLACGPALLSGCMSPLPVLLGTHSSAAAEALLREAAEAHGAGAYAALRDINVSYAGEWRAMVDRLQPALVDAGFRATSQERLLPGRGIVAQRHRGPSGHKQVLRRAPPVPGRPQGEVQVWFNDEEARDATRLAAAALVADAFALCLLGPLWLAGRAATLERGGLEEVDGRPCDLLYADLAPGLGLSTRDRLALCIDRADRLMRRVRFSLDGLPATQGAIAEVDTHDLLRRHGVVWPTRFYERLRRPVPNLPVHEWRLTGLDVNRGYDASALDGPAFTGAAVAPAAVLVV